ncbi:hypothetical protein NRH57_001728 [Providencia rettgeri]|uniref:hypothetical protein n=1 Tax=Providencia TaxID=586 RepID=UPI002275CC62|nr:hypothetical protein [Providencia rettgeri]ELR5253858.1 hypothetical protein [Providencia rettgeri]ELR5256149.1 hypothetical protein [Providencia rettgeri]ELT5687863.1 hypothetical protein [Providencia rettgeri]MCY0800317.1 hypothetical protein [Providencia rettgeri]
MKSKFLATALLAAIAGVSMGAQAANNADVTLLATISDSTCNIEVNNNNATLDVGTYSVADVKAVPVMTPVPNGAILPVKVDCAGSAADQTGSLVITGQTSTHDANQTLFVGRDANAYTGFLIKEKTGFTAPAIVKNAALSSQTFTIPAATPLSVDYDVNVATADLTKVKAEGLSSPIKVAFVQ